MNLLIISYIYLGIGLAIAALWFFVALGASL